MSTISFRCIEETDELSPSDSPFFLVYVGDSQHLKSDVQLVRQQSWDDNVDAGEPARTATVNFSAGGFNLVLVALFEEDWDNDFKRKKVDEIRDTMNNLDTLLQPGVLESNLPEFTIAFNNAIKKNRDNDDLIKMRRIHNHQTLDFIGEGAHYSVTFNA